MSATTVAPKLDAREEHFYIPGPRQNLSLFLRYLPTDQPILNQRRAVIYIHGATFPSGLSIVHRFSGHS
jgi:hypothetical protein